MLDAFKLKEFNLEPIYASWTDAPVFHGKPKKDLPVKEWLDKIKAGCVERKVPKEYWHKVGQHFMGEKARARLYEVKTIMAKVHGGSYRWDWKKFKTAMENMGWDIDTSKTETIKIKSKPSGTWWASRKDTPAPAPEPERPAHHRAESSSSWLSRKVEHKPAPQSQPPQHPAPIRTESSFWGSVKDSVMGNKDDDFVKIDERPPIPSKESKSDYGTTSQGWKVLKSQRPVPVKSHSIAEMPSPTEPKPQRSTPKPKPPTPARSNSMAVVPANTTSNTVANTDQSVTTVAQAPVWLLNACGALDFLTSEHPKVMTALSAILITIGSIPAIPAISAGAGGAILASSAAQAAGAIAVGVGSMLKAQQEGKVSVQDGGAKKIAAA
jgi:hypothetical protein